MNDETINSTPAHEQSMTDEKIWHTSASEIRNDPATRAAGLARQHRPARSQLEKGLQEQIGIDAAVQAVNAGTDPTVAAQAAVKTPDDKLLAALGHIPATNMGSQEHVFDDVVAREKRDVAQEQHNAEINPLVKLGASIMQNSVTGAVVDMLNDEDPWHYASDSNYDPMQSAKLDDIYKYAQDSSEVDYQLEARSDAELTHIRKKIDEDRMASQTIAAGSGAFAQMGYSLLGGVVDPLGWAAGLGASKALTMAGVGAEALAKSGTLARVGGMALDGAVGNVAATAVMDASGKHTSGNDYLFAAGMGGIMTLGMAGIHNAVPWMKNVAASKGAAAELHAQYKDWKTVSAHADAQVYGSVVEDLGTNASPAEINAEVVRRQGEAGASVLRGATSPFDDVRQVFPTMDAEGWASWRGANTPSTGVSEPYRAGAFSVSDVADENAIYTVYKTSQGNYTFRPGPDREAVDVLGSAFKDAAVDAADPRGVVFSAPPAKIKVKSTAPKSIPGTLLNSAAEVSAVSKRWGLDALPDAADRALGAEAVARAERWAVENPIDEARLKTLLTKVKGEANATTLLASKNPLMRMVGGIIAESPQGAAGREVTAAVSRKIYENVLVDDLIPNYDRAMHGYFSARNTSPVRDAATGGKIEAEFRRRVSEERARREAGDHGPSQADPAVEHAADTLDAFYKRAQDLQVESGTTGAARVGARSSRGYGPRRWAYGVLRNMDNADRRALTKFYSKQFQEQGGYDKTFADKFSVEYMNTIMEHSTTGYDAPAVLTDPDSAGVIKDTLTRLGIDPQDQERILGRFSRGGASHTKSRIDLDLTQTYQNSKGEEVSLHDYLRHDHLDIAREYAKRVAGEVALSRTGIPGDAGMRFIRRVMSVMTGEGVERPSNHELAAFDQVHAEMLGRPSGTPMNKHVTDAMVFNRATKLNGMGFTQMGESANGVASLGVASTFSSIAAMPKMYGEIRNMLKGGDATSLLKAAEPYLGKFGLDGYHQVGAFDTGDVGEIYGRDKLGTFSKALRTAGNKMRVLSFHRAILATQQRAFADRIMQDSLGIAMDRAKMRAGNPDVKFDDVAKGIADMGMTDEFFTQLEPHLKDIVSVGEDGSVTLNLTKSKDQSLMHDWMSYVQRGTHQIIMEPYVGERGAYARSPVMRLATEFRTFGIQAVEKQWGRQRAVNGTSKALGYLLGSMAFAIPIHLFRVGLKAIALNEKDREEYFEKNTSITAMARASLNYASASGVTGDMLDFGSEITGLGQSTGGRVGAKGLVGGLLFPTVGSVNSLYTGIVQKDPKALYRAMPGNGLPYLTWGVNWLSADK